MKKIRFGFGGILMIAALLVSDSAKILGIYFFAALLHEMGHLLMARFLKINVKEIRFGVSGVRIVTGDRLTSYKNEILLSLAGPAVNLVGFASVAVYFCLKGEGMHSLFLFAEDFLLSGNAEMGIQAFFALASLLQALTNLLPVKSFDGGRILYCATASFASENTAERILEICSAFSAFLLWTVALYLMLRINAGVGIFAYSVCLIACTKHENNYNI